MRVLTIVKQVPDSNATVKPRADGTDIEVEGVKFVLDPFDEFGVELAIQLREKKKNVSEIVVLTLGPDKASEALRVALAMGADSAIHINDPALISRDELSCACVIAEAIKKQGEPFDLIICGKFNIDLDACGVGPAVAEFLDLPHVGAVQALDMSDDGRNFVAKRRIEGAEEVVECALPAVLTIEKGLVEPRYPSLPNLMKAKKKPVMVLTSADLKVDDRFARGSEFRSIAPPQERSACKFIDGEPPDMARELVRLLREEAKVL